MVWTRLSSHASTEKNQPTAVLLVLSVGCGSPTKLVCYQSLTPSDCNTSGYPFMGLPLHQPSSSCRFGPLGFSVGTGGVGILPDGQLVLLALVDLPRIRWLPMGSPSWYPNTSAPRMLDSGAITTSPWHQQYAAVWVKCQEKSVIIWESWQKRPPWKQQWKNIWSIFPKDWPTLREMNGTSTIGSQIYILKCKFSLQPIN